MRRVPSCATPKRRSAAPTIFLSRGNIQSAYGRIARRQGKYERALECFERAIAEYRSGVGDHLQLARALLNLAFVKRLLALQFQKDADHVSASRRSAREDASSSPDRARELRLMIERVRGEAHTHLEESMAIYERRHNHRGIAGVHVNKAFLCLDAGDLECAAAEAAEAFRHGEEKRDYIVMARARTLQCIVESAALEEQVGDPAFHHETAEAFARDAVTSRVTPRTGACSRAPTSGRAYVCRRAVWRSRGRAPLLRTGHALLQPDGSERQYVWDDLETLKSRVLHARPVDPQLRAWSAGVVEDKSFSQLTEEFARMVIPKVWEREGRKVSRVAEKLSISPKKVRRILQSAGVHNVPQ